MHHAAFGSHNNALHITQNLDGLSQSQTHTHTHNKLGLLGTIAAATLRVYYHYHFGVGRANSDFYTRVCGLMTNGRIRHVLETCSLRNLELIYIQHIYQHIFVCKCLCAYR